MKTLNKVLISKFASILAFKGGASARGIHMIDDSCLVLSDQTVGQEIGEFVTNENQLTSSSVHELMRLHSIKTCKDTDGNVSGLQFSLATNIYNYSGTEILHMEPIGHMTGQCDTLVLRADFDTIHATLTPSGLDIIYRYHDGPSGIAKSYGAIDEDKATVWIFDHANPVIGLYGRHTEAGIAQLGFITLDTAC